MLCFLIFLLAKLLARAGLIIRVDAPTPVGAAFSAAFGATATAVAVATEGGGV
jgi:hypothetical protein